MTKKRILNTDELKRLVKSVDSDWEVGLYLLGYILNNVARINAFLKEHDLNKKFFYPIANIFALVSVAKDKGVTNSLPLLVRIILISTLFFFRRRMRSNDL